MLCYAIILTWGYRYLHKHLNDKSGSKRLKRTLLTNTTSCGEPGWKTAVNTNSVSAIRMQRLEDWSEFLRHIIQLGAAPTNCTNDSAEHSFHIMEDKNYGLRNMCWCSKICHKVSIWLIHFQPGRKLTWFSRIHFSPALDNRRRIMLERSLDTSFVVFAWESITFLVSRHTCPWESLPLFKLTLGVLLPLVSPYLKEDGERVHLFRLSHTF